MEEIPSGLEKEIARLSSRKTPRKSGRWMLLFVNETGKIVSVKRFKWLLVFLTLVVISALAASGAMYFLLQRSLEENRRLRNSVTLARQSNNSLKKEKEKLATRLIMAEARIRALSSGKEKTPQVAADKSAGAGAAEKSGGKASAEARSTGAEDETGDTAPTEKRAPKAEAATLPSIVDVEDFRISRNAQGGLKQVQFKVRNIESGSQAVSGYTFIVFRQREEKPDNWLIFPKVDWTGGKPSSVKSGRHFSIYRFKTVTFNFDELGPSDGIETATVMVYEGSGSLIFEKRFDLTEAGEISDDSEG